MRNNSFVVHPDCAHFRGDVPCVPHKKHGAHCRDCSFYSPQTRKILIVKLGAIGDVIRTTPLVRRIRKQFPQAAIWWLTRYPEVLPAAVHRPLPFTLESTLLAQATDFDMLINLDKDAEACAIASLVRSREKRGFILKDGKPAPVDENARHKFITGLFDDVNQNNTKSYPREIFEICGWNFRGEEYILDVDSSFNWHIPSNGKPIVGLNTGCGGRWISRLWSEKRWEKLIDRLLDDGVFPLLLGGEQEHEKNTRLAERTGAWYPGHFSLKEFISLVDQCDAVVTGVTMAMHVAIGLKKPLVLFVNIFNPHEFELYNRGEILMPRQKCQCFFQPSCSNTEYSCMEHLDVDDVHSAVARLLKAPVEK